MDPNGCPSLTLHPAVSVVSQFGWPELTLNTANAVDPTGRPGVLPALLSLRPHSEHFVLCICSSDPHALQILMNDLTGIIAIAKVQYLHLKTE